MEPRRAAVRPAVRLGALACAILARPTASGSGPGTSAGGEAPEFTKDGRREYWESVYRMPRAREGPDDWYGPWDEFKGDVAGPPIQPDDDILVIGCGISTLSTDLARDGFRRVTSIDISDEAVRIQRERFPELRWLRADARRMDAFADRSFDVVVEKGTLDSEGSWGQHYHMFMEISRILRPRGRYVSITVGQPEEVDTEAFFNNASYGWSVEHALSYDDYYVWTMTKYKEADGQCVAGAHGCKSGA